MEFISIAFQEEYLSLFEMPWDAWTSWDAWISWVARLSRDDIAPRATAAGGSFARDCHSSW